MASHRAPKTSTRAAAYTVVGLAAGTVALLPSVSEASPAQSFDQVKSEVNSLNAQLETATQHYDAAQEQYAQLQQKINGIQAQIVTETGSLHTLQKAMGLQAGAQYQQNGISPTLQLALSADPEAYLTQASAANETGLQDAARLKQLNAEEVQLRQDKATASTLLAQQQSMVAQSASNKATIQSELNKEQALLNSLTAAQRAQVQNTGSSAKTSFNGTLPPVSGRAGVAVAYAKSKLGDEYVYGGNGPNVFDCSGLTQEAWKAAGVSIQRTSYEQYDSLPHVSLSNLQPGDLVFFYPSSSGPGHVAIYVGNGELIHAPHTGTVVQYASLYGSDMPIVGAARP